MKTLLLALISLCFVTAANAQWQTTTYALKGGWNSIYLHGDATHATPDELFAANPEVLEVWRWNPNPSQVQFISSPLLPTSGLAEWTTWKRDGSVTTLSQLLGQTAYLVKCSGSSSDSHSVTITQRMLPPSASWVRNGANLMGFPSSNAGGSYPSIVNYFATFPVAIASGVKIYKYVGGEIGPSNPIQVFSPSFEALDRNQSYWFDTELVGNFYAPLEVSLSKAGGLDFGRSGSVITLHLRNRSAAVSMVTLAPVASESAPAGQTAVTGSVPLTLRTYDANSLSWTVTAISGSFTQAIAPNSSVELSIGIDRGAMSTDSSAFYASLLRLTDSSNLIDIYLPAQAQVASLAGLWIGDATVSNVNSKVASSPGSTTPRSFPLRYILHLDNAGTARLLSQVYLGTLVDEGNPEGICTKEAGLKAGTKAAAVRMSVAHLPLDSAITAGSGSVALGATLVRNISIPYNSPTNPFVHQYHPDHDNKDARPDGTNIGLADGVESYGISRQVSFEFTNSPPEGVSSVGWGSTVIGGNYTEVLSGLHKESIRTSGTFILQRASENGAITVN